MIRRKIKSFRRRCRQHFSTQKIKVFTTTLSTTLFDAFNVGVNRRFDCRKPGGTSLQHFRCERHKTTQVLIDIFTKTFFQQNLSWQKLPAHLPQLKVHGRLSGHRLLLLLRDLGRFVRGWSGEGWSRQTQWQGHPCRHVRVHNSCQMENVSCQTFKNFRNLGNFCSLLCFVVNIWGKNCWKALAALNEMTNKKNFFRELRHAVFSEACSGPLTPNGPELRVFPNPETSCLDVG